MKELWSVYWLPWRTHPLIFGFVFSCVVVFIFGVPFFWRSPSFLGFSSFLGLFSFLSVFEKGHLPLQVIFHQRSSSTEGHLPSGGRLPLKVIFQRRSSSTKSHLPLKVVFHSRLSYMPLVVIRIILRGFFKQGCIKLVYVVSRIPDKLLTVRRMTKKIMTKDVGPDFLT